MDTWTTLALSHLRTGELRREAARHRLAQLAAASRREPEQGQDSRRTATFTNLQGDSHRRLSTLTKESS